MPFRVGRSRSALKFRVAFTLIELLVVIAIVAVLSVVIVLTLNPAELLKQTRDSTRLSDLTIINKSIGLYLADRPQDALGVASTTYVSIPDPTATTTSGTNCAGIGLSTSSLPSGWSYHCAASSTLKNTNGTGWIPINFSQISSGPPLERLPIDPLNTSSTGNYYTYTMGGSWALSSMLESQKYLQTKSAQDGGYDPGRYEAGSDLALVAQQQGLMGWWQLEEETSTTAIDSSRNGNNLMMYSSSTPANFIIRSGCKVGGCASLSSGQSNYLTAGRQIAFSWSGLTYGGWVKTGNLQFMNQWTGGATFATVINSNGTANIYINTTGGNSWNNSVGSGIDNSWHHVMVVYSRGVEKLYVDGMESFSISAGSGNLNASPLNPIYFFKVGANANAGEALGSFGTALVDDLRLYNRALTAVEISAIYNAQR